MNDQAVDDQAAEDQAIALAQVEPAFTPAPEPLPVPAAPRLHYIDGLRGLAMLLVLVYHCWLYGGEWKITLPLGQDAVNLAGFLSFGHVGVNLFLVLSGFCLYWPFTRPGKREPTLLAFAQKRCRRILPPYYAALLLFWAFLLWDTLTRHDIQEDATTIGHAIRSLGWHLVLLHNLRPEYILSINGVFWSLALEFSLYIFFPILVEGFRRLGPWLPALVVLAGDLAWRFWVAGNVGPDTPAAQSFTLCNSLPGRAFEFAAGMVSAWTLARLAAYGLHRQNVISRVCNALWIGGGAAAVWVTERYGAGSTFPDALWGLCFAALVVAASRHGSLLHRILSAPGLVCLGVFSYSVYLVHLPLTKALDAAVLHFHLPAALLGLGVIAPLMLVAGYGFHVLFERPFMQKPPSRRA